MAVNKAFLDAIIGIAADGIIVFDAKGIIQAYNPACEWLFGYAADEVVGSNVKVLLALDGQDQEDYFTHYRASGGREISGRRKDGSTFPMYLSIGEGRLDDVTVFIGIVHDISQRVTAENALREREAKLTSILDTGPDAIIIIDEQGIVESFSPAAVKLFGYSTEDVVGQNVRMLMPSPYREQHDKYLSRYRATSERRIIGIGRIVAGQRRDGTTFPMELAVGEIWAGDRRLFTGFVRDITERQRAERGLQDLQAELAHVSRLSAMGEMSSALAHELNQPLTAITNYVKAAHRTLAGTDGAVADKARELMDKAAAQTTRAGQIIRRLRDFIEKGETTRASENLNGVVEEAAALGLVGAANLGVRVRIDLSPDLPAVRIDKIQIQQVILNLIRNAVEAMQDVSERQLTIATSPGDQCVLVGVSDTGPGLDPEVAHKLFQPFVTTKDTGMGIGLSICRSIIEAHGGELWATPNQGAGVAFQFRLPVSV